jgi:hypothetical protein
VDKVGGGEFEVEVDTSTSQPYGHFNWQELYERLFKAYEAQKEQYRVLTDEMLVLGDERNAAVKELEIYRQRESKIFNTITVVTS